MKAAKLRTKDVTFSDRISRLPNDLLLGILSLIPVSDAMYTSLLSKRWKSLWKMLHTLEYDESSCDNIAWRGFNSFCKRSLQLHEALFLKALTVKLGQNSRDLKLPSSFPNLVLLKLHTVSPDFADSPPSTFCFQSLKSLHLTDVRFRGVEAFCRLTSACPVLEDLFFDSVTNGFSYYSPSFFTISVPSLQRLEIKDDTSTARNSYYSYKSRFKINTPSLKYLNLSIKFFTGRFELYEDMPNLETFQWSGYKGREEEKKVVLFILHNAPCLKTAEISLSSNGPRRWEKKLLMIQDLETMPKVSTSCKLVVRHR